LEADLLDVLSDDVINLVMKGEIVRGMLSEGKGDTKVPAPASDRLTEFRASIHDRINVIRKKIL
jgi:hypothetical protein